MSILAWSSWLRYVVRGCVVGTTIIIGIVVAIWMLYLMARMVYELFVLEQFVSGLRTMGVFLLSLYVLLGLSASHLSISTSGIVMDWSWYKQLSGTAGLTGFLGALLCLVTGCIYLDRWLDARANVRRTAL